MKFLVILSATLLVCCAPNRTPAKINTDRFAPYLPIRTELCEITPEQIAKIRELLAILPLKVLESISSITISGDKIHFKYGSEIGHTHTRPGTPSKICLDIDVLQNKHPELGSDYSLKSVLFHEAGHAYANILGLIFELRWQAVAGNAYKSASARQDYPRDGLLHKTDDFEEDIADWNSTIYRQLTDAVSMLQYIKQGDWRDPRYLLKLNLLFETGFINKNDYEKIKPLLE